MECGEPLCPLLTFYIATENPSLYVLHIGILHTTYLLIIGKYIPLTVKVSNSVTVQILCAVSPHVLAYSCLRCHKRYIRCHLICTPPKTHLWGEGALTVVIRPYALPKHLVKLLYHNILVLCRLSLKHFCEWVKYFFLFLCWKNNLHS